MAELIAEYSPPIPAPVRKRHRKKNQAVHEAAVARVARMYTASVIRKSFFRPKRSVSWPKKSAPTHAPAT
jgi:hypothetical protein